MMTHEEWLAKKQIMKYLAEEGRPTYAKLLDYFDLNLTADPECAAYMIPGKATIVINRELDIDQVSTIVRHEILHEFFTHQERLLKHLGVDADQVSGDLHQLANIAGDYDISNKGYTDKDKRIVRRLKIGNKVVTGLVTEDQHEDWLDLSFEEMFDKLKEEMEKNKPQLPEPVKLSDEYIAGWNKAVEEYNSGKLKL